MTLFTWIKTKLKHRKYKKFIKYYKSNPDEFCEQFLDIELFGYQRKTLREMNRR